MLRLIVTGGQLSGETLSITPGRGCPGRGSRRRPPFRLPFEDVDEALADHGLGIFAIAGRFAMILICRFGLGEFVLVVRRRGAIAGSQGLERCRCAARKCTARSGSSPSTSAVPTPRSLRRSGG